MELIGRYSNLGETTLELRKLADRSNLEQVLGPPPALKQVHRRLRPAETERLVAGYLDGLTVYQLADQFAIHRATVSLLLERQGVPRRNRPLSPDQVKRAGVLYAAGQSLATVGGQLGCHASTIYTALRKVGVVMRDPHGRDR